MLSLFIYFTVNPIESPRSIIYSSVDESAVDSIAHVDAQIHYQIENGIVNFSKTHIVMVTQFIIMVNNIINI